MIAEMRKVLQGCLCFVLAAAVMLGLLVCGALVPREAIRKQMEESAEYLCRTDEYAMSVEGVNSTRIDHYADAVLLNIAWYMDPADPLRSALIAEYYDIPGDQKPVLLREALEHNPAPNDRYLRYWHGSLALVRPMLAFMTLPQIYTWHAVLLGLLAAGLLARLLRRKDYIAAAGILAGLVGTACWYIPRSLEFTWVFLIMLVQLHLVISRFFPKDLRRLGLFFLLSGMVTNYLDFLSCETLTLLMPLLMLLWIGRDGEKPSWKTIGKAVLLWGIGYGGMYLAKWAAASLAMGESALPYVAGSVGQRLVGSVGEMDFFTEHFWALFRNVYYVFPMDYGPLGTAIGIALVLAAGYIGYVHRRKGYSKWLVARCAAVGAVPFLRYLVLINHSFMHAFFTYRAQFSVIFAVILILAELTGWGRKKNGKA